MEEKQDNASAQQTATKKSNSFTRLTKSAKGSDLLVFIVCLAISSIFWLFLSLYDEVERDYDVPFVIENQPDSIVIVESVPTSFNVVVQGKGVQFLRFLWHDVRPLKVNFNEYANNSGYFTIPRQKLDGLFRDYFGQGVKIVSLRPETVKAAYTSNVGKKVPLELISELQSNMQYVISGPLRTSVDSVMVYSANDIPATLTSVTTCPLVKTGLKDTTTFVVKIRPIEGMRIIPDQVTVTVPVEPLIAKKRTVPIEVQNVPEGTRLITFPSSVEVNYLVPMSLYSKDINIRLFVDYSAINRESQKVKVQSSAVSGLFRNFSFKPDSVEYIIESMQGAEPASAESEQSQQ